MNLAPIILFVYNRPYHTRQTINSLKKNDLAEQSQLYIYSDGPKNESEKKKVTEVRTYIKSINGFKKITIFERKNNWGLANSIINGVSKIIEEYGKVIVLEDDIITSPYFLKYMNDALNFYQDKKKIWHISGWNYPIKSNNLPDTFLWKFMNCWGWSTWKDRWSFFNRDIDFIKSYMDKKKIRDFTLNNTVSSWKILIKNERGEMNTWAVFWNLAIYINSGLCLNPSHTLVKNIGLDGSGVHCDKINEKNNLPINNKSNFVFPTTIEENKSIKNKIIKYLISQKKNFYRRVIKTLYFYK